MLSHWGRRLPRRDCACFLRLQASIGGLFLHQVGDPPKLCVAVFAPLPALNLPRRPLSLVMSLPFLSALIPAPGLCRPGLLGTWLSHLSPLPPHTQICKGASADERLQWHLPEGATFSWLPNPERTLEGGEPYPAPWVGPSGPASLTPHHPC